MEIKKLFNTIPALYLERDIDGKSYRLSKVNNLYLLDEQKTIFSVFKTILISENFDDVYPLFLNPERLYNECKNTIPTSDVMLLGPCSEGTGS